MNKIKRFISTACTYLAGNVLSKLITFFMLPIYTNKLNPEAYGDYDLVITIVTLFLSVAFFQIWDGMFRFAFDYSKEEEKYSLIYNSIIVYCFGILVYSVSFFILYKVLEMSFWQYAYFYGVFFALQYMYSFMARAFLKNKLFVISGTINTLITAVCNIVLILCFDWGVKSLYLAPIIGCIVQIVIIDCDLKVFTTKYNKSINFDLIKAMLKFSIPLCISTISYWLLSGFTKVIIHETLGSFENGIYAVANTLANIVVMAVNVFQFAWNEMAYLMNNDADKKVAYKKSVDLLIVTVIFGCACVCIGVKIFFPILIGEQYSSASSIVPILLLGVSANSIAGFLGTLFMTEKKTIHILYSTLIAAGLNLVVSYPLTKAFGIYGSVIVLSSSFVLLMILRLVQTRLVLKINISFKSFVTCAFVVFAFVAYVYCDNLFVLITLLLLLFAMYIFIVLKMFNLTFSQLKRRLVK